MTHRKRSRSDHRPHAVALVRPRGLSSPRPLPRRRRRARVRRLRPGQVLFTYLHLAADREQALGLMKSGATAIAYETVTGRNNSLPLLTPMSEVAGRMSIQVGASCLQKAQGGFGVLLGGVPGVPPAKVVIPAAANSAPKSIPQSPIGARSTAKPLVSLLQQNAAK